MMLLTYDFTVESNLNLLEFSNSDWCILFELWLSPTYMCSVVYFITFLIVLLSFKKIHCFAIEILLLPYQLQCFGNITSMWLHQHWILFNNFRTEGDSKEIFDKSTLTRKLFCNRIIYLISTSFPFQSTS